MEKATKTTISLKLLVNKDSGKVLFAEAGKEFVDFLFGLLELPFGSIVALMVEHGMVPRSGCFDKIYQSVQNLSNTYLQKNQQTKDSLLRPMSASTSRHTPLLKQLAYDGHTTTTSNNGFYGHNNNNTEGYVKEVVTYMVMDDLEVKPMSTISSVTVLNTFDVQNVGCLQEKTVEFDMGKGLELLKASFESTTILTDLFLGKKPRK